MEWISVKDKTPEDSKEVLAWSSFGFYFIAIYSGGTWFSGDETFSIKQAKQKEWITHYMPLPEPPTSTL